MFMDAVIVTQKNDLKKLIAEAIRDEIATSLPELVKEATKKPYITKEELMDLTGWSSRTIQHLRDTNQIPYSKHGRKILYPRKGILEFLEAHHIKPDQ
jgi:hypothetical protein